jgi:hypothetical protein
VEGWVEQERESGSLSLGQDNSNSNKQCRCIVVVVDKKKVRVCRSSSDEKGDRRSLAKDPRPILTESGTGSTRTGSYKITRYSM